MKKRKGISKDFFLISVITTITAIFWVFIDINLTLQKKEIPNVLKNQMETLNPKLDFQILDDLDKKSAYDFNKDDFSLEETPPTNLEESTISAQLNQ